MRESQAYLLWLYAALKQNNEKTRAVLDTFSSAKAFYHASDAEHRDFFKNVLHSRDASETVKRDGQRVKEIRETLRGTNTYLITLSDDEYPRRLREIQNPPVLLFVQGTLPKDDELSIAVVGARVPTQYGRYMTRKLTEELAQRGVSIISGLARGVDGEAHESALKAGGRTVGVLGCGIDKTYPRDTFDLRAKMTRQGAVVSEFLPGSEPIKRNFPRRNRIVSGLSDGVLVTEAALRSGSLVTAKLAGEQGREVFAVPGNADEETSAGCHWLIQNGAKLTTSYEDILEEYTHRLALPLEKEEADKAPKGLTEDEAALYGLLSRTKPKHTDELSFSAGMDAKDALAALFSLEMKDLVEQLPGGLYVKR